MTILSVKDVTYLYRGKYQTVAALRGVSAEFDAGTFYAVTGPSGSGKTTFLSLLAGLSLPTHGRIEFDGQQMLGLDRDAYRLRHVAMIFQNFNLFQHLTVLENAAFVLYARNVGREEAEARAKEELTAVGLPEAAWRRLPKTLSGGEQQRVAIARALASGAELVLADEPTGNLDRENGQKITEIMKHLAHTQNRCVIVVTHDPELATQADVRMTLRDGLIC